MLGNSKQCSDGSYVSMKCCFLHNGLFVLNKLHPIRTTSPGKKFVGTSDHPQFALVNPSFGKSGKGPTGCQPYIGTACLVQLLTVYDGDACFVNLLNKTYQKDFALKTIRSQCGFSSSSRIYCLVMFQVKVVPPRPMECKLRLGFGTGFIPLPSANISSFMSKRNRTDEVTPIASTCSDPTRQHICESVEPDDTGPVVEPVLKVARCETHPYEAGAHDDTIAAPAETSKTLVWFKPNM